MPPRDPIARTAVEVLCDVLGGAPADRTLKRVFRQEKSLRNLERKTIAAWVYQVALHRARLAYGLGGVLEAPARLRAQLLLAHFLATDEKLSVAHALARVGLAADAPGSAALLQVVAHPPALPDAPVERMAITRSLPFFVAEALADSLGLEQADLVLAHLNQPGPITLRAHGHPPDRARVAERLRAEGIETCATPYAPWGLHVVPPRVGKANLWGAQAFREGLFEVQDEGSQIIAWACAAQKMETVVDYCAGRGGKTLALAASMEGKGRLIAADVDANALRDLKTRLKRSGETWVECRVLNPASAALELPAELRDLEGSADLVLVDGPCSAVGSWRRGPHRRWELEAAKLALWPPLQQAILSRASRLVRPGGRLLYATCTLLQAENEGVRAAFLARNTQFQPLALPLDLARGASELLLTPHKHGCDGFYLAHFHRGSAI